MDCLGCVCFLLSVRCVFSPGCDSGCSVVLLASLLIALARASHPYALRTVPIAGWTCLPRLFLVVRVDSPRCDYPMKLVGVLRLSHPLGSDCMDPRVAVCDALSRLCCAPSWCAVRSPSFYIGVVPVARTLLRCCSSTSLCVQWWRRFCRTP